MHSKSLLLYGVLLLCATAAHAQLKPEQVPAFQIRARVTQIADQPPGERKFTFRCGDGSAPSAVAGDAWSEWIKFDRPQVEANLKGYPAIYLRGWPVVTRLTVEGVDDPTLVEAELKFDEGGDVIKLTGELFGPALGVNLWREDDGKPQAATHAQYNHRYWKALEGVSVPPESRPKLFPTIDRFIGGDDDRRAWREGIEHLNRAGFSAIMLPPDKRIRNLLLETGQRRTAWAVYNPPGYAFDFDPAITHESIRTWAAEQAKPYRDAGYDPRDMAVFAMSDEPGWYYPQQLDALKKDNDALARFRKYLEAQGLKPADVGANTWDEVQPSSQRRTDNLAAKRLFYWSMRFFAYDSATHFAQSTRALEEAFYPNVPIFTNWNFFSGRFYVPGPVANNSEKKNPDAGMGGHDWLEFGRLRGGTMLWTEDWFSDAHAYQWSFYCAKLRSAAAKGKVQFGGYVIPRTAGDREDGLMQKILCIAGSGGKAIKYYVFGPEYNFPGNCYSERPELLKKIAEAQGMIGAAEEQLWPGTRPRPQVAILHPRSAEPWDARDVEVPQQIQDATHWNQNTSTVDYMAETFNLYLALQHANIPVDFVEEDDLSPDGLAAYRVLYVTEPNVPVENQQGLVEWVKRGGTLVTVSGAATRDRYDEPATVLSDATGVADVERVRMLVADANGLPLKAKGDGLHGPFSAFGVVGKLALAEAAKKSADAVVAKFEDGSPAVVLTSLGQGRAIHFAWLPGVAYWRSSTETRDKLPVGFSEGLRKWIVWPTELAKVQTPVTVNHALVETPILVSDQGAAITLLNWTGAAIDEAKLTIRPGFAVKEAKSVKRGPIAFTQQGDVVSFALPLVGADIVVLK